MNINIEVYKNSLNLSDQQAISVIKKVRYILSRLHLVNDVMVFSLGNILKDKQSNTIIFGELKKLINMAINLTQSGKISKIVFCIDDLFSEKCFVDIVELIKFSGITRKTYILTKSVDDDVFATNFPELNIEKCEKFDIMYKQRFMLDQKHEFICKEDI